MSSGASSVVSRAAAPLRKGGWSRYPTGSVSRSIETAATWTPGTASSSASAARIVASRSPRFAPSATYARVIGRGYPAVSVGRRLAVLVLALGCLIIWAAGAQARVDADPPYPQEWWLSHVGADRAAPPGPGVPIAIIDSGVDPTHEEFANRPNTSFLNDQTTFGREEFHGTAVASVAAAPDN